MKELYAATTTESVLLIIGASILISGIIIGCAMIRDYRNYLNEHIKARFTLADFFRRERFLPVPVPRSDNHHPAEPLVPYRKVKR